jgi:hypothetical protein
VLLAVRRTENPEAHEGDPILDIGLYAFLFVSVALSGLFKTEIEEKRLSSYIEP